MRYWRSDDFTWRNAALYPRGGTHPIVTLCPTANHLWRVVLPSGHVSDEVNLGRAKDAAVAIALRILNRQETASGKAVAVPINTMVH